MDVAAEAELPVLAVEGAEFAADPEPFLIAARKAHPWLARFSQGYVVHGYDAQRPRSRPRPYAPIHA